MNFIQKSFVTIIGKFSGAFLSLITSVVLARNLGVSGIGQYQLLIASQTIAITIAAMGFGNATIYFVNNLKFDKIIVVSNTLKLYLYVSLFLSILFALIVFNIPEYFGVYNIGAIISLSIGAGALLLYNILLPILYIDLEVVKAQIVSILTSILMIGGLFILYMFKELSINSVVILLGICNIASLLLVLIFLKDIIDLREKINWHLLKNIFIYGVKISATNLVFILSSNIVIFLLKKFNTSGFDEIGLYSRAVAIINIFVLIPISIGPLIYSKWSGVDVITLRIQVQKTIRILILLSFLGLLFILIFGEWMIVFLYGIKFIDAKSSLFILSSSVIFTSITSVLINLFSSIGKPLIILRTFSLSLVITIIFSIILIPKYGIEGASVSVLVGLFFNSIVLLRKSQKEISLNVYSSIVAEIDDLKEIRNIFKIR